jgi:hypothetical protein
LEHDGGHLSAELYVLADLVINVITMSVYFTLAFTWFQGYVETSATGKLIMRAMALWWFLAGVHSLTYHVSASISSIVDGEASGAYAPDFISIVGSTLILMAAVYFLYATVKRNPPKSLEENKTARG